jgi:hypothetical protein
MKRGILFMVVIIACVQPYVHGQYERPKKAVKPWGYVGPVGGLGHSWVHNMPVGTSYRPMRSLGVGYIGMVTRHWGAGGALLVSSEGYEVNYPNRMQSLAPMYLRMPARLYYFFGKPTNTVRPDIYFGPSVGVKIAEHNNTSLAYREQYKVSNSNHFNMYDAGLNGGAGLSIRFLQNLWLNVDMGVYTGATDAVNDMYGLYNPQSDLGLNIGLLFGIR